MTTEGLQTLKLEQLHESPWNPRKYFDAGKLQELADSIKANGIIEPLLARPNAKGFELAAGHRRFRAARLAGLEEAPVIVRAMADKQFLEVLLVDNLQREDLSALEEAEGYKTLMSRAGYDVRRIAERVGRSEKYVYDRVKLLELLPAAATLLREGQLTAGHAILLARLKPKDQQRALDDGTFQTEQLLDFDRAARKAVSVRELQAWIDKHVRFETKSVDPMLFPDTAVTLAKEKPEEIIPITPDHYIDEKAREGRTFGPMSWRRADGKHKSKTCDHSMTGVIVVGAGRGDAFKVCTAKEKCKTHWDDWQRERAKRATSTTSSNAADRQAREQQRYQLEQEREEVERARFRKARPAILDAIAEKIRKAPIGLLRDVLIHDAGMSKKAAEWIPRGSSAEDLVRHLAFMEVVEHDGDYVYAREDLKRIAKDFGVDVKKIIDQEVPAKDEKAAKK